MAHELTPADLLVKAAMCFRFAWYLRGEPHLAWELVRRGDQAMAEYDRRTASLPERVAAPAPSIDRDRPSLIDRLFGISLGSDVLP